MIFSNYLLKIFILLCCLTGLGHCHGGHKGEKVKHLRPGSKGRSPVFLISFDGFRYDYLDRLKSLTSAAKVKNNFQDVISDGIWAKDGTL